MRRIDLFEATMQGWRPPDQCLHSAEADVRPQRRRSGFGPAAVIGACRRHLGKSRRAQALAAPLLRDTIRDLGRFFH
jgi:hypothetical protein